MASHSFQDSVIPWQPPTSPWLLLAGSLLGNVPEVHLHKQPRARFAPQEQEIKGAVGTVPPKAKAVCRMGYEVLFQEISSCLQEGGAVEGVEEKWREREREKERVEGGIDPRLPCPFSCW